VKWGYISAQKLETERSKSFPLSFNFKPNQSGGTLVSPGLENIPQVPGNGAEVGQNNDAGKAVLAAL